MNSSDHGIPHKTSVEIATSQSKRPMTRSARTRRNSHPIKRSTPGKLILENIKLRRRLEILDSQPDLTVSIREDGSITYMSERSWNILRGTSPVHGESLRLASTLLGERSHETDPVIHMSQILLPESLNALQSSLRFCMSGCQPPVQEVRFLPNASGLSVGYLRVARVIDHDSRSRSSKHASDIDGCDDCASLARSTDKPESAVRPSSSSSSSRSDELPGAEFVCTIRPAEQSLPPFDPAFPVLSTASLMEHDRMTSQRSNSQSHSQASSSASDDDRAHMYPVVSGGKISDDSHTHSSTTSSSQSSSTSSSSDTSPLDPEANT